ncbi:phosphate transporter [Halorhabdus utahensis DSM 12940]|uniref:Phosphate transporter n=1 Tax=Halorhabdus utahensis (strain DSM 12940 / JCM 11049 / AX-2) TaxID=519442 RepID=C7NQI9_HALUD|nr:MULTISPECIES: inorganic phosphate transporter [Halorhabdus]ACV10448.1 phosphate transporter [Halorhabdus utahensis DSM 12940]WEL17494.1 Phosphate/sulfate permease [Halorhabdus sp. SVX81]
MEPATIALFGVATVSSLGMAWVIGAGSSGATPFAPAVGANAISTLRAALVVGVLGFLGAVTQGGNVSEAVGSGLIKGVSLPPTGVIAVLLIGAGLMAIGIKTGYPIATAFTVTGAVIGVGLAMGGDPAWAKYGEIGALWVLTPIGGGAVAFGIARTLPRPDVPEDVSVPILAALVGAVVVNLEFAFLGSVGGTIATAGGRVMPAGRSLSVPLVTALAAVASALVVRWDIARDLTGGLRRFLLALGSLVAFSAGASQVGLAVGPLVPLFEGQSMVPTFAILLGGGFGMLVGSWTGAPRMITALSQEYASLGPRRSIATLVPSFLIAQIAVLLGVPVSFNEIIVSGIVGSGLAVGGADVSRRKLVVTVLAWIGSLAVALGLGYGVATLFVAR